MFQIEEVKESLETVQNQQSDDSRAMSRNQKTAERYLSKRQTLMDRKDELAKLIRDLGVLPESAFEKYKNMDTSKVSAFIRINSVVTSADALPFEAAETSSQSQRGTRWLRWCQQKSAPNLREILQGTK